MEDEHNHHHVDDHDGASYLECTWHATIKCQQWTERYRKIVCHWCHTLPQLQPFLERPRQPRSSATLIMSLKRLDVWRSCAEGDSYIGKWEKGSSLASVGLTVSRIHLIDCPCSWYKKILWLKIESQCQFWLQGEHSSAGSTVQWPTNLNLGATSRAQQWPIKDPFPCPKLWNFSWNPSLHP